MHKDITDDLQGMYKYLDHLMVILDLESNPQEQSDILDHMWEVEKMIETAKENPELFNIWRSIGGEIPYIA